MSSIFRPAADHLRDPIEHQREQEAKRLLRRANLLLRWYRALTTDADVLELSLSQAGQFVFMDVANENAWSGLPLEFALPSTPPVKKSKSRLAARIRSGLLKRTEPDVGHLNILDAQHAANTGRFREAVLLAWSAIDASFTSAYERAIGPLPLDEYADGWQFLLGHEVPMKVRMTAILRLATGRSLFQELGREVWGELAASYTDRNSIIHRGAAADQAQAERAIAIASQVTALSSSLTAPKSGTERRKPRRRTAPGHHRR